MAQILELPAQKSKTEKLDYSILKDNTFVYDLIEGKTLYEIRNKYADMDVVAFRIHGLIGDVIKATTILSPILKENPNKKFVILQSYNDATKRGLIKDIFSGLIDTGVIIGLYLNEYSIVGNISYYQYEFLRDIGCTNIIDLYYYSSDGYNFLHKGLPYLGFPQPEANPHKVAMFRFSGFHSHVPLRHIKEDAWLEIEKFLIDLGLDVYLFGYDDTMKTLIKPENDFRKKLTVLDTIKHAADSGLCISTTTYLPHYLHHFVPCLVYADPADLALLSLMWRHNHNFMVVDTTKSDYTLFVKNYALMWRMSYFGKEFIKMKNEQATSCLVK